MDSLKVGVSFETAELEQGIRRMKTAMDGLKTTIQNDTNAAKNLDDTIRTAGADITQNFREAANVIENLTANENAAAEALQEVNDAAESVSNSIANGTGNMTQATSEAFNLGSAIGGWASAAQFALNIFEKIGSTLWNAASAAVSLGVEGGKWLNKKGNEYIVAYNTQFNAENRLKLVGKNMGLSSGELQKILQKASEIQSRGIYGDEGMLEAAGELATYTKNAEAILKLMDTVANFAIGMNGVGELSPSGLQQMAEGLGKAFNGQFALLTKKGFSFTDEQKKIIESGDDLQKALTLDAVISESWKNLYDEMSKTPQGRLIQLKNLLSDFKESAGAAILGGMGTNQKNNWLGYLSQGTQLKQIQAVINSVGDGARVVNYVLTKFATIGSERLFPIFEQLKQTFTDLKPEIISIIDSVTRMFKTFLDGETPAILIGFLADAIKGLDSFLKDNGGNIALYFKNLVDGLAIIANFGKNITSPMIEAGGAVTGFANNFNVLLQPLKLLQDFTTAFTTLWYTAPTVLQAISDKITTFYIEVARIFDALRQIVFATLENGLGHLKIKFVETLKAALSAVDQLIGRFTDLANKIKNMPVYNAISAGASFVQSTVQQFLNPAGTQIMQAADSASGKNVAVRGAETFSVALGGVTFNRNEEIHDFAQQLEEQLLAMYASSQGGVYV